MLFFFPLTAIVYFLLGKKSTTASQLFLVLASVVFYSWFHWSYSLLLLGSIFVNHFFAQWLYKNNSKLILTLGILCNVLALGYFKYYDFFVENINAALGTSFHLKHILLPLGISFFTFQQVSFLQLVYSRQLAKRYNLLTYSLFVCFFPQLIAGPIVLPDEMMSQFDKKENLTPNAGNIAAGLYTFALGLGKKILLADFFAEIADAGFAGISGNFFEAWETALAYTFQIYFDFSGYCDMGIGIGMVFNIFLPQNFSAPYRADNITDFWRKWHMTLGRFLMTTIYIPLGGNRKGTFRTYLNLLITFFISGLWHGAYWLFVLWGMLHGAALILHRVWSRVFNLKMPKLPARLLTFFFVLLAWVPFRATNWNQAEQLYKAMFLPGSFALPEISTFDLCLFLAGIFIIIFLKPASELAKKFRPTWINALTAAALMIVSMFFFVKTSPFIYFNF
jgi:D-alanyl-lipoteichoic acid acyltransferase DltB (MBOAT superfamily)